MVLLFTLTFLATERISTCRERAFFLLSLDKVLDLGKTLAGQQRPLQLHRTYSESIVISRGSREVLNRASGLWPWDPRRQQVFPTQASGGLSCRRPRRRYSFGVLSFCTCPSAAGAPVFADYAVGYWHTEKEKKSIRKTPFLEGERSEKYTWVVTEQPRGRGVRHGECRRHRDGRVRGRMATRRGDYLMNCANV